VIPEAAGDERRKMRRMVQKEKHSDGVNNAVA